MSTHATLAYLKDGVYYAKNVHYGLFDDVKADLSNATSADIIKSVDKGDSTSIFAGFYSDPTYCKEELNWPDALIKSDRHKPTEHKTIKALTRLNPYTYVLVNNVDVVVYRYGRRSQTLDLTKGDRKGAIRDAISVKFMYKGLCVWISDNIMQFVAYDDDSTALYVLVGNRLIKANVESETTTEGLL